ncbi:hypothetical protein [Salinigranum sp. GCM10025319]|uniref:hypothetical protein n=1 Tax=Salinigranum sp. GCM10025319 TaxID=3252687 RepID=UPI00361588CC
MAKRKLLKLTLVVHAVLAAFVAVDARRRGRCVGKWVALTLLTGLVGVLLYLRSGGDEDLPLDELVDRVELE